MTVATLARRDADAEQMLIKRGLIALDSALLQWRGTPPPLGGESLWTLVQEEFFGDFHADVRSKQTGLQFLERFGVDADTCTVLVQYARTGEVV